MAQLAGVPAREGGRVAVCSATRSQLNALHSRCPHIYLLAEAALLPSWTGGQLLAGGELTGGELAVGCCPVGAPSTTCSLLPGPRPAPRLIRAILLLAAALLSGPICRGERQLASIKAQPPDNPHPETRRAALAFG